MTEHSNANNGHRGIGAADGRSRFARLWREIEKELLQMKAAQTVCDAQEHERFYTSRPYEAHLAKLTPEQFIDQMFPFLRREVSQQARRLALEELRLDREISEFCDDDS